jgi:hypothetical protein
MVRAKFTCAKNVEGQIHLHPVYSGSKENEQFFQATPGGHIQLMVASPPAAAQFIVGKSYYVDFTEADAPPAATEKKEPAPAPPAEPPAPATGVRKQIKGP